MSFFNSKVILITGATSGIGEALAFELALKNAHIIIAGRNKRKLAELETEIKKRGSKCLTVELDLSNRESIENATQYIKANITKLDILINNGGISQRSFAEQTDETVLREIMEVNFFGTIKLTNNLLPLLQKEGGNIAVTSSLAGKFGTAMRSAYSSSKHALHGYYESLRYEQMKNNIKVSIICPGFIKTDISLNALTANGEKHGKMDKNQAAGMSAEKCAKKYLSAIKNGKKEVFIGGFEVLTVYIKRFLPFLFYRIIANLKE